MNKRTTVYVDEDVLLILKYQCGVGNISDLIRDLLDAYIFDATGDNLRAIKQENIRKLSLDLRTKRESQKKLIEEDRSEKELEHQMMMDRLSSFASEAEIFFSDIYGWKRKLPEQDRHGDYIDVWTQAAQALSDVCCFPVSEEECFAYVRSRRGF